MVIEQLQSQTVRNNGGLTDGDIGKRTGMDQNGLMLDRVAHGGVDGVAHPCGHGAGNFEVLAGDGVAALGVGNNDLADTLTQILQIAGDSEDRHQLGANGNAELGLHQVAVQTAADAHDDIAKTLCAEVQDPAHLHTLGVDIQTLQTLAGQPLVVVVALVLHTRVQSDHRQVVRVHDIVDIAGQTQGELGHRHQKRVAAAGSSALDVHRRTAGGLTQSAANVQTQLAETFDQTQRDGGLALAERGRGDCGDFNELAVGLILQAVHDLDKVNLRGLAVGNDFFRQQTELLAEVIHRRQRLLRFFSDLPVLVYRRVERNAAGLRVNVLAIFKFDCHGYFLLVLPGLSLRPRERIALALCIPSSAALSAMRNRYFFIGSFLEYH